MPPQSKTATAKKAQGPVELCIRCPDHSTAKSVSHKNDFNKCLKHQSTTPEPIKDKHGNDTTKTKPPTHSVDQLWWGFADGPNTRDLNDTTVCKELLEVAKKAGSKHKWEPYLTDEQEWDWLTKVEGAKQQATFKDQQITKDMLENAVKKAYAPKSDAEKKAEKEQKKQEAVASQQAILEEIKKEATAENDKKSTGVAKTSASGQPDQINTLAYRPKDERTSGSTSKHTARWCPVRR